MGIKQIQIDRAGDTESTVITFEDHDTGKTRPIHDTPERKASIRNLRNAVFKMRAQQEAIEGGIPVTTMEADAVTADVDAALAEVTAQFGEWLNGPEPGV